ncbi:hypothetical protein QP786_00625 [Gleimia europaea]|nr:hypothetical protein [Gleimia europaea]MDK8534402.1 hypothetical protein [Gleimia europaea]
MSTVVWLFGAGAALMVVAVAVAIIARRSQARENGEDGLDSQRADAAVPAEAADEDQDVPINEDAEDTANQDASEDASSSAQEVQGPANEVLSPAADPLNAFDLDGAIREMRREYWASRWMFGEDACADLRFELGRARALAASCLADATVVEGEAKLSAGCTRMNAAVSALREPAEPLRSLRANKYTHALAVYRAEDPASVNPHRAAVRAGRYVSPDPTFGLARLASEIEEGLATARLEVARVSPTAGSEFSARMRAGLVQAQKIVSKSVKALASLQDPVAADLLQIEADLLRAAWIRRAIDLTSRYLPAKEWARASGSEAEWTRLAVLSTRIAEILIDLRKGVEAEDLAKLAGCLVLLDAGPQNEQPTLPVRTCEQITRTCEQIALAVSKV